MNSIESLRERIIQNVKQHWREYIGSAEFWEDIHADLAREKPRHPTPVAIRKGLASGRPVPEWAADYIAKRLDGSEKLPRGVPRYSEVGLTYGEAMQLRRSSVAQTEQKGRRSYVVQEVWLRKILFEIGERSRGDSSDPYREAAAYLSEQIEIPVDMISHSLGDDQLRAFLKEVGEGGIRPGYRPGDPYRAALAAASRHYGIPEDTLDKWCYPRRR